MDILPNPPLFPARSPASGTQGPDAAGRAAASAASDFDSFLRLLTTQLRNQDPLQPLDSTEFVAQLASFSTVEQLIGANDRLDRIAAQADADAGAAYGGWIGREVGLSDGSFVSDGAGIAFDVPAQPGATAAVAEIRRADGALVREIPVPANGARQVAWDGRDGDGAQATGPMRVEIVYAAAEEPLARRAAQVYREVLGLLGTEAGPLLVLADGGTAEPASVSALRAQADAPG